MPTFKDYYHKAVDEDTVLKLNEVKRRVDKIIENHVNTPSYLKEKLALKGFSLPESPDEILNIIIHRAAITRERNIQRHGKEAFDKMFPYFVFDIETDDFDEHSLILTHPNVCFRMVLPVIGLPTSQTINIPVQQIKKDFCSKQNPDIVEASRIFTFHSKDMYTRALLHVVEGCYIYSKVMNCLVLGSSRGKHVEFYKRFVRVESLSDKYGSFAGISYVVFPDGVTDFFIKCFGKECFEKI